MKKTTKIFFAVLLASLLATGVVNASEVEGDLNTGVETGIDGTVVVAPTASLASGTYTAAQSVSLAAGDLAVSHIRYTTDGTAPDCSTSTVYSGPITISATTTLTATTCLGSKPTSVFTYTIIAAAYTAPTASPDGGTYSSTQSVALTASGANSIYYTIDGTDPVCGTTGLLYSGTITISSTKTIKAVSCYSGGSSSVASFAYTISSSSSGGGGGGGSSSSDDDDNPYIVSIKVYDGSNSDSIAEKDYIKIAFSEAIDPDSINSALIDGGSVSGVGYSLTGGISITSAGVLTIKGIALFDVGTVGGAGNFGVDLKLSSNGKILTITLADGDNVGITKESFASAAQIGGTIGDEDGDEMESDTSIDEPEGTFGPGTDISDTSEGSTDEKTGDINGDGNVDEYDFALMMGTWGKSSGATGYNDNADLNDDDIINEYDFSILMLNWGK